jgi:hypothetical protein
MMFIVSLIEFSKHVQNEISAKVMPKPQNFTADFADRTKQKEGVKSKHLTLAIGSAMQKQWPVAVQ